MSIGTIISDLLRSFFKRPATEMYPFVKKAAPERFRGKLHWDPAQCTGCQLCIKDCPANAIELMVVDKVNKRFVMRYHADRCIYCSQCVETCRFKCLSMSDEEWELAAVQRQPFEINYGREEDVQFILDRATLAGPEEPCKDGPSG